MSRIARQDYEEGRRHQAQGQVHAAGPERGRVEDAECNAGIAAMLTAGMT
ncbi:hypothetical protein QA634_34730 [Methylobacterium sp. CB376]|nr:MULTISPECIES: hypothetical protein [Methylobacterium]WFT80267.1 hypothetical protein QA634_34730 [Methylobacterium nodulans]